MENLLDVLQKLQDFNQHCNELVGTPVEIYTTDVLEVVKKARKVDFNAISYARKSYVEMMELNARCGMNIKYLADYDIPLDELKGKSISELIFENPKERDSFWVVDFTKELVNNTKKEIESNPKFKYIEGQLVNTLEVTPTSVKKFIKKIMSFKTEADKEFLKLLDSIVELEFDKECCGEQIIVERSLKEDLLEEDYKTLQSNFENTIEDLIEYNIYHVSCKEYAKSILNFVKKLVEEGYTPSDICLDIYDDWEFQIKNFLDGEDLIEDEEFGYSELENKLGELDKEIILNMNKEKENERKREANIIKSGNAKKSITIKRISDGEILSFETKGECMKYLNTSPNTFSKFIKGQSKLNKKYTILGD